MILAACVPAMWSNASICVEVSRHQSVDQIDGFSIHMTQNPLSPNVV
jgi:hypothetical protein